MSPLLRGLALAALLCAACDAGSPRVGSPGLEPPHGTEDGGGLHDPGGGVSPPPTAGTGTPSSGAAGTSAAGGSGAAGSGMFGNAGTAGSAPTAGMGGDLSDAGVSDAGSGSFSELHAAELTKDCQETVLCRQQRAEPLEDQPLAACLEDSAALLDSDESLQAAFLANVARCQDLVACDYYDCALAPP